MKVVILFLIFAHCGAVAQAGMSLICMERYEMEAALIDWYGAAPIAEQDATEPQIQIWVAAESGTWAMIRHLGSGQSCVLRKGDHWQGQSLSVESVM